LLPFPSWRTGNASLSFFLSTVLLPKDFKKKERKKRKETKKKEDARSQNQGKKS
jgi:hypothetical protein